MKKILITGASGFIGRNTIKILIEKGFEVHALTSKNHRLVDQQTPVYWHKIDLFNHESISDLMAKIKPHSMLHFAWDVTPGRYINSETNLSWIINSIELLKSFKKYGGKRFVFAGTCFQYDLEYGFLIEEKTPSKPSTLYGVAKNSFESIAMEYCDKNDISFASGRIFYLYGERENESRLIPYVINSLIKNEVVNCSHGNQVRDYMHVEDVARAFVSIVVHDIEGVINIGSGKPTTLRDIVIKIADKFNKRNLLNFGGIPSSPKEPPLILANNEKLKTQTDWLEVNNMDTGLERTIEWWIQTLSSK